MTQVIRSEYRLGKCWLTKLSDQFSNIDQKIKATHGVAKKKIIEGKIVAFLSLTV